MFTFNGISKKYIRVLRGFGRTAWAPIELDIVDSPGRAGGMLVGRNRKSRVIEVPIEIRRNGILDLQKTKEEMAAWLNTDTPVPLSFSDEPDRVYYAMTDGQLNVDEILDRGKGTITFICPDPNRYGMKKTLDGLSAINNGTTDTPFKLKMTATAPATYLSISDGVNRLGIGKPASNRFQEELKFNDDMSSLLGWSDAPGMPSDSYQGGVIKVVNVSGFYGHAFQLQDSTTEGDIWRGRTLVKSATTMKDFRVEGIFEVEKIIGQSGTARQYVLLVDSLGKEIARIGLTFISGGDSFEVRIGKEENNQMMIKTRALFSLFEHIFVKIKLSKQGNVYRASVIKVDRFTGVEIKELISSFYTDVLNQYSSNAMSAVAVHAAQHYYQPLRMQDIKVYEYVDENTINPNVVQAGDVIEIDTDAQLILINGQIRKQYKSIESDYFNLPPGKNQLFVNPDVTKNHEITYRERYL